MAFFQTRHVGLFITERYVDLVRLQQTVSGFECKAFARKPLPEHVVKDGVVLDSAMLKNVLRLLVLETKTVGAECSVAVAFTYTTGVVKSISLPQMTEDELDDSIQWEAEQYIPFDIKEVNVSYQIMDPNAGQLQMDVQLVAQKKDSLNAIVDAVKDAGLKPTVFDIAPFALANSLLAAKPDCSDTENVGVIMITHGATYLSMIQNKRLVHARLLSCGLEQMLADAMKLNESVDRSEAKVRARVIEVFVAEIARSLDYFSACTVNWDVGTIYVPVDTFVCEELVSALSARLGVKVSVFDPADAVIGTKPDDLSKATIALALARRSTFKEIDEKFNVMRINLCPSEKVERAKAVKANRSDRPLFHPYVRLDRVKLVLFLLALGIWTCGFGIGRITANFPTSPVAPVCEQK